MSRVGNKKGTRCRVPDCLEGYETDGLEVGGVSGASRRSWVGVSKDIRGCRES